MHQSQASVNRQIKCEKLSPHTCNHRCTCRMDCAATKPARDPLAALEAARKIAWEQEEAERWDGLS